MNEDGTILRLLLARDEQAVALQEAMPQLLQALSMDARMVFLAQSAEGHGPGDHGLVV